MAEKHQRKETRRVEETSTEHMRAAERMCTLMRNRGKKIILFHPQRENNKLFM